MFVYLWMFIVIEFACFRINFARISSGNTRLPRTLLRCVYILFYDCDEDMMCFTRLLRCARYIDWKFQARDWMHSSLFMGVRVRYSMRAMLPRVCYSTRILGFPFLGKCTLFIYICLVFTWCRFMYTDAVAIYFRRRYPFALWIMFRLLTGFGLVDASLYEILWVSIFLHCLLITDLLSVWYTS